MMKRFFHTICCMTDEAVVIVWVTIFIGPESDHWLPLSVTDSLTYSYLAELTDVSVAMMPTQNFVML